EESVPITEREVGEAAIDVTEPEGQLVRIGQIKLGAMMDAGRAKRKLPPADPRTLDGDREKDVRVVEVVVIEEIFCAGQEIVGVEGPSMERNGDHILLFFIPFAVQRNETQIAIGGLLQERARNGEKRRGLIKVAVKS